MPRKNISDMLHRSVAGAVLFSICHFAAAETENFDFWGLTSPTYLGDPSDDKFWESLLDGTPILSTHYENILSDAYWNDAEYASEVLNYGFINQNMSSVLLAFDAPTTIKRELDLRILDANHERSSSPVLGIQTIPVSQFQVNFEKAVNLEIQRLNGTGSLAINVEIGRAHV